MNINKLSELAAKFEKQAQPLAAGDVDRLYRITVDEAALGENLMAQKIALQLVKELTDVAVKFKIRPNPPIFNIGPE